MPSIRLSKILLVAAVAFNFTLIATNNLLDYDSNYNFLGHVISMDTTFPGNSLMWRSITSPVTHTILYILVIISEFTIAVLLWIGVYRCLKMLKRGANAFNASKKIAIWGLTLSLLLWLVPFLTIGGEWFAMWQSHDWNGIFPALKYFAISGIVLLYLNMKDE